MILNSAKYHVLIFKIPSGKCFFTHTLHGGGLSTVVQGHLQVSAARTNKDSESGGGHFVRVDNCHIGGVNLVTPVEESCLSLSSHDVLHFKLRK